MAAAETRICQNCKSQFIIEPDDFSFYEKIKVPPPTWCPECRLQRRLAFRNERSLYKRKCDLCKQDIISMYSPDKPFKVYCPDCYHSDRWNPLDYGREYDFSKPFFLQWQELQHAVPHLSLLQYNTVNSPWVNYEADVKNCYLDFGGHLNEDCAYNQYPLKCRDCLDNFWPDRAQFCYEDTFALNDYKVFYSTLCFECRDTYFSFDCRNCSNIIGCTGLRHKQYYIWNEPASKEEFETFLRQNPIGSYKTREELWRKAREFWRTVPQRALFIDKSVNVRGNLVEESKNCAFCWNAEKCEDGKYLLYAKQMKDAWDTTSAWWGELFYEAIATGEQTFNIRFSYGVLSGSTNAEYSHLLFGSHNTFGCLNLRSKNFCVLNKQYSEADYEDLVKRIRIHMDKMPYRDSKGRIYKYGEFFPSELSPYGYNETVAFQFFPLTQEETSENGFQWSEYEPGTKYTFSSYEIPDHVKEVGDDVLEKVLKCGVSGKAYRLIPSELAFYRRFEIPIPRISPFERHKRRLAFVTDHRKFYQRNCRKCGISTKTVYSEEEFPIIYCQDCYLRSVV